VRIGKVIFVELPIETDRIAPVIFLRRMHVTQEVVVVAIEQYIERGVPSASNAFVPLSRPRPFSGTRAILGPPWGNLEAGAHEGLTHSSFEEVARVRSDVTWLHFKDINLGRASPDERCKPCRN
jgi:hypothetical protein